MRQARNNGSTKTIAFSIKKWSAVINRPSSPYPFTINHTIVQRDRKVKVNDLPMDLFVNLQCLPTKVVTVLIVA